MSNETYRPVAAARGSRMRYGPLYAMLAFRSVVIMSGAAVCILGTWWHSIPIVCLGLLAGGTFSVGSSDSVNTQPSGGRNQP